MSAPAETRDPRHATFRRLKGHNRRISLLRVIVPAVGGAVLAVIAAEMVFMGLLDRFGFSDLQVDRGAVTIAGPRYAGTLADGSTYVITAETARAKVADLDAVTLGNAHLLFKRKDGLDMMADAARALLKIHSQQLSIPGLTHVADSRGARGTLVDTHVDWRAHRLDVRGKVHIINAAGSVLDASGAEFDQKTNVWTFHHVTLTLPQEPGTIE